VIRDLISFGDVIGGVIEQEASGGGDSHTHDKRR